MATKKPVRPEPVYEDIEKPSSGLIPADDPQFDRIVTGGADKTMSRLNYRTFNLSREDVKVPHYKLVQAESGMPGAHQHHGQFWNDVSGLYLPAVYFVPISVRKTRALYVEPFDRNADLLCGSYDSLAPYDGYIGLTVQPFVGSRQKVEIPNQCAECPLSEWSGEDGRTPPRCSLAYLYYCYDVQNMTPFIFRMQGGQFKVGKKLNTNIETLGLDTVYRMTGYTTRKGKFAPDISVAASPIPDRFFPYVKEQFERAEARLNQER